MERSLTNVDIKHVLPKTNIVTYNELPAPYGKDGSLVILFRNNPQYGHWTVLFKQGDTTEFFDSYGIFPDKELEWTDKQTRAELGQLFPELSEMLLETPGRLEYNNHQFQELKKGVNTCGRWVILRLAFRSLPIDHFYNLMVTTNPFVSLDEYAVYLTDSLLPARRRNTLDDEY